MRPKGGLFLCVTLPKGLDANELLQEALKQTVAFVPGDSFYAPNDQSQGYTRHLPLSFSNPRPEQIREGIRRLSVAIKMHLEQLRLQPVTEGSLWCRLLHPAGLAIPKAGEIFLCVFSHGALCPRIRDIPTA